MSIRIEKAVPSDAAKLLEYLKQVGGETDNLTFGPDILKAMKKSSSLMMDVHVMISDPMKYAPVFIKAGADLYTFHYEAVESVVMPENPIDINEILFRKIN